MRLIDSFLRTLAYTAYLIKNYEEAAPSFESVLADYEKLLVEAEETAGQGGFDPEDVNEAKFAVCAWVDESIMLSEWEGRTQWAAHTLQRIYFSTANAGEEFFQRLESIPAENLPVMEVYATCLSMGFTGRYYEESARPELENLKERVMGSIWGAAPGEIDFFKGKIFPRAYPAGPEGGRVGRAWKRFHPLAFLCLVLPPALLITLFVIYRYILGKVVFDFFKSAV